MKRAIALGTAAAALVAAPVAAAGDRAIAPVEGESELGGSGLVIGLLGAAAVIAAIILIADDDDEPASP